MEFKITRPVRAWIEVDWEWLEEKYQVLPDCVETNHIKLGETSITLLVTTPSEEMRVVSLGRAFEVKPKEIQLLLEGVMNSSKGKLSDRFQFPPGYVIHEQIPGKSECVASAVFPETELNQALTLVPPGFCTEPNLFAVHEGGEVEVSENLTQGQTIMVWCPAIYEESCIARDEAITSLTVNVLGFDKEDRGWHTVIRNCTLPQKRLPNLNQIELELMLPEDPGCITEEIRF
jgi:hypothetical protein